MKQFVFCLLTAVFPLCSAFAQDPPPPPGSDVPPPPPEEVQPHHGRHAPVPPSHKEFGADELFSLLPEADVPRLKKLYEEDREAFFEEAHKILEEKRKTDMREIRKLKKQYAEAKNDEERKKVRDELRKKAEIVFDRMVRVSKQRILSNEMRIKEMKTKLDKSKQILQDSVQRKNDILDEMVDQILSGKKPTDRPHKSGPSHRLPPPPPPEND